MLQPVILCGGDGTRLWPASRKALPKQFMPLHGSTLFIQTLQRAATLPESCHPLILCNNNHRFLAAAQLQEAQATSHQLSAGSIILEPAGKNTAPAITIAALHLQATDPVMLVLPSDHSMTFDAAFLSALQQGIAAATQGKLVTFGIIPTRPETGYGYIKQGQEALPGVFTIEQFTEKPDATRAHEFIKTGGYFWNSGMFLFKPSAFLRELKIYSPAILEACEAAYKHSTADLDFLRLDALAFASCPSDSVDYAVMEHTKSACVVPLASPWNDLGSWQSIYDLEEKDDAGNAITGDVVYSNCSGNLLFSQSRLVTAIGLHDMVVVETPDAVMIAPQTQSQDIKSLVAMLKTAGRPEAEQHARVYRPWGSYEQIAIGDRFQVKRIIVNPGQQLSLQKHYHRAEHWVVVHGTAAITVGTNELLLSEDESTYIPLGSLHRLANPGKVPLEIIEIQTGSYLGEDDIVRIEDCYGR